MPCTTEFLCVEQEMLAACSLGHLYRGSRQKKKGAACDQKCNLSEDDRHYNIKSVMICIKTRMENTNCTLTGQCCYLSSILHNVVRRVATVGHFHVYLHGES